MSPRHRNIEFENILPTSLFFSKKIRLTLQIISYEQQQCLAMVISQARKVRLRIQIVLGNRFRFWHAYSNVDDVSFLQTRSVVRQVCSTGICCCQSSSWLCCPDFFSWLLVCVFQYPMPRLHTTEEVMENAKKICDIVKGVKIVSRRIFPTNTRSSHMHDTHNIMNRSSRYDSQTGSSWNGLDCSKYMDCFPEFCFWQGTDPCFDPTH